MAYGWSLMHSKMEWKLILSQQKLVNEGLIVIETS